jgi:hypothetical protein
MFELFRRQIKRYIPSMLRAAALKIFSFALALLFSSVLSTGAAERWRAFQEKPQAIRSLLFKRSVPLEQNKTEDRYVHARWQADAFYSRELERLGDLDFLDSTPHGQFLSQFGTNYWLADGKKLFMYSGPPIESVQLVRTSQIRAQVIDLVLNHGISNVRPGSIVWKSQTFTAEGEKGSILKGQIELDAEGDPQILNYTIEGTGQMQRKRVRYYYTLGTSKPDFPFRMMLSDVTGQTERLRETFEIYQIETQVGRMPEEYFNPDLLTVRGSPPTYQRAFYGTNGITFEAQPSTIEITCPR